MRRGLSLVEILVAAVIMGGALVVVYGSSVRGAQVSAWSGERALAEGILGEMVTYYRALDPCNVPLRAEVAGGESGVTATHRAALEAVPALSPESLGPADSPIAREYGNARKRAGMEREAFYDAAKKELGVAVSWKAATGQSVRLVRRLPLTCGF